VVPTKTEERIWMTLARIRRVHIAGKGGERQSPLGVDLLSDNLIPRDLAHHPRSWEIANIFQRSMLCLAPHHFPGSFTVVDA
jgi:hypothetical protein